jgi:hypothetical protein
MAGNDRKLLQLWQQFDDACQKRAYGPAIQSLALLNEAVGKSALSSDLRQEWSHKIAGATLDDAFQAHIRDWARDYIERVNLISTGGQLDSYDSLYVATAFESLQGVQKLLQQRGLAHLMDFDTVDPDAFRHIRR